MQHQEQFRPVIEDWRDVEVAYGLSDVVTGTVVARAGRGYRVALGAFEAFLPVAQPEYPASEPDNSFVGRRMDFRVAELNVSRKSIVLSRLKH
jgi:ribosomal protein S1